MGYHSVYPTSVPLLSFIQGHSNIKEASEKAWERRRKAACNEERQPIALILVMGTCKFISDDSCSYTKGRAKHGSLG